MLIVRENTEGEYSSVGGRMYKNSDREIAIQETIMSRHGVDRVQKFAFELTKTRKRKKLTNATKSNGISITMPFWDERFNEMKKNYLDIETDQFHIDILVARFVLNPEYLLRSRHRHSHQRNHLTGIHFMPRLILRNLVIILHHLFRCQLFASDWLGHSLRLIEVECLSPASTPAPRW